MIPILSFVAFIIVMAAWSYLSHIPQRKRRERIFDIAGKLNEVFSIVPKSPLKDFVIRNVRANILDDKNEARLLNVTDTTRSEAAAACELVFEVMRSLGRHKYYELNGGNLYAFVEIAYCVKKWTIKQSILNRRALDDSYLLLFSDLPKEARTCEAAIIVDDNHGKY